MKTKIYWDESDGKRFADIELEMEDVEKMFDPIMDDLYDNSDKLVEQNIARDNVKIIMPRLERLFGHLIVMV